MEDSAFTGMTSSEDQPSVPVPAEIAEVVRAHGAALQEVLLTAEVRSAEPDSAVVSALAQGSGVERIAADADVSVDLVDFIVRGGRSWEWFLNRGLYASESEASPRHPE